MVFQWTFNDLRGLSRFLADLSVVFVVSVVSKTFWNGSKQSFSGLSGKWSFSSLSAISQWTFKGLISLSMIFRQSLLSSSFFQNPCSSLGQSFRVLSGVLVSLSEFFQWSRSVFQRSWLIFQRSLAICQMIFQWSLNSLIGLSVNFQLSSRSYGDLAGKVVLVFQWSFRGFRSHSTETANFTDLADCWKTLPIFGLSVVYQGSRFCGMGAVKVTGNFLNLSYVAHTRRLYAKVWPRHYSLFHKAHF